MALPDLGVSTETNRNYKRPRIIQRLHQPADEASGFSVIFQDPDRIQPADFPHLPLRLITGANANPFMLKTTTDTHLPSHHLASLDVSVRAFAHNAGRIFRLRFLGEIEKSFKTDGASLPKLDPSFLQHLAEGGHLWPRFFIAHNSHAQELAVKIARRGSRPMGYPAGWSRIDGKSLLLVFNPPLPFNHNFRRGQEGNQEQAELDKLAHYREKLFKALWLGIDKHPDYNLTLYRLNGHGIHFPNLYYGWKATRSYS